MSDYDPSADEASVHAFLKRHNVDADAPVVFKKTPPPSADMSPMRFFEKGFDAVKARKTRNIERLCQSEPLTSADIDRIMAPLNTMYGLHDLKTHMRKLIENRTVQQLRASMDLAPRTQAMHMVFTGPPGTGKTTAAHHVAKILHDAGITSSSVFMEAKRADLVGQYVGETERNMLLALTQVRGGVLFIDEAYSLNPGDSGVDYGRHVIETLVAEMDKPDFNTVIILAGYSDEMNALLASNTGLRSRIGMKIGFKPYTASELTGIVGIMAEESQYHLTDAACTKLAHLFRTMVRKGTVYEGNARTARQIFDTAVQAQTSRVLAIKTLRMVDLVTIIPADIPGEDAPHTAANDTSARVVPLRRRKK